MEREYYTEFYNHIDGFLQECMKRILREEGNGAVALGPHDMRQVMMKEMFAHAAGNGWRDHYSILRNKGYSIGEAFRRIGGRYLTFAHVQRNAAPGNCDFRNHIGYEALSPYRGQLLVYIHNARHLAYLKPLIANIGRPVFLLSLYELPDDTDLPDHVTAFSVRYLKSGRCENAFLETYFPQTFVYGNVFDWIIGILAPRAVALLEGGAFQQHALAEVCRHYRIPSYCIQHGWPSLMHPMFREMPYSYFLTWGERFSELWKRYNPAPHYKAVGYLYPIAKEERPRRGITFFLQAPVYLSNYDYLKQLLRLAKRVAREYPQQVCMVREHPTYPIPHELRKELEETRGIRIVSNSPLEEVFAETLIAVSHFSSSLMEGMVHGCVPLVYDPTIDSRYYPDIEKEGVGKITKNEQAFMECLALLMKGELATLQKEIGKQRKRWFSNQQGNQMEKWRNPLKLEKRRDLKF